MIAGDFHTHIKLYKHICNSVPGVNICITVLKFIQYSCMEWNGKNGNAILPISVLIVNHRVWPSHELWLQKKKTNEMLNEILFN